MILSEQNRQKLDELYQFLILTKKGSIIFIVCNEPVLRNKLYEEFNKKVGNEVFIYTIQMEGKKKNLIDILNKKVQSKNYKKLANKNKKIAFFVQSPEKMSPETIGHLNFMRNSFYKINHPIVLWANEATLENIAKNAPDFWSWRSKVFEFKLEEKMLVDISSEILNEELAFESIQELEKKITVHRDLLNEYKTRGIVDHSTISVFLLKLGILHRHKGELENALDFYNEAIKLFKKLENKRGIAITLHQIASIHWTKGNYDEAFKLYDKSLKISRNLGEKRLIGGTLHHIANVHYYMGNYDEALKLYKKSKEIFENLGAKGEIAGTLHQIAMINEKKGNYDEASKLYDESLKISRKLGNHKEIAGTLHQIASINQKKGNYDEASKLYDKAIKLFKKLGDKSNIAITLHQIAIVKQNKGNYDEAIKLHKESLRIKRKLGNRRGVAYTLAQISLLYKEIDRYEKARKFIKEAIPIFEKLGNDSDVEKAKKQLSDIEANLKPKKPRKKKLKS